MAMASTLRSCQSRRLVTTMQYVGIALVVITVCSACSASGAAQHVPAGGATATYVPPRIPAGWHLYRDPRGYFTLGLPLGWNVVGGTAAGHGVQGGPTGSATTVDVSTAFFPPAGGPQNFAPQLRIDVTYTLYTDTRGAFKQPLLCEIYTKSDTTIGSVRAQMLANNHRSHLWAIATSAVAYQVSYGLPSDWTSDSETVPPTPVPQATVTADLQLVQAILATFAPIPATPPKC